MAAKKKGWSRVSKFTLEERQAIVAETLAEDDSVVAQRHGVAKKSLINWRKRLGVNKKKRTGWGKLLRDSAAVTRNGASNGHEEEPPPSTSGGLGEIQRALEEMLASTEKALTAVRRHREHAKRVFLGEG